MVWITIVYPRFESHLGLCENAAQIQFWKWWYSYKNCFIDSEWSVEWYSCITASFRNHMGLSQTLVSDDSEYTTASIPAASPLRKRTRSARDSALWMHLLYPLHSTDCVLQQTHPMVLTSHGAFHLPVSRSVRHWNIYNLLDIVWRWMNFCQPDLVPFWVAKPPNQDDITIAHRGTLV